MKQLSHNFKMLDMFGQETRLLAAGQTAFRTLFGSCATLLLFSMLVYACITFIYEMNKGKNAILSQKEEIISEKDGFTFNTSELVFSIGLLDSSGKSIPNQNQNVYRVKFYNCSKTLGKINCTQIPSSVCGNGNNQKHNIPSEQDKFLYCLDEQYLKDNPIIRLSGSTRQENYTLLSSVIERCSNSTNSQTCASNDEIDAQLKNSLLHYQYSFHQFNKELDDSPYEITQNVEYVPLYRRVRKFIQIYFQYSYSLLEYNPFYFFPISKLYQGIEFQTTVFDNFFSNDDDGLIVSLALNLDVKKVVRNVTYQTLIDVAAKLGGLYTIIRAILYILLYPIQFLLYRIHLINVVIKHKNAINNQSEMVKPKNELSILSIIKQSNSRQLYCEQSRLIEKLLDITEILVNPLKIIRQVEDLQGSIRKFDVLNSKQANMIINLEMEDSVSNNEMRSLSRRTINQEIKLGSSINFQLPSSSQLPFKKK